MTPQTAVDPTEVASEASSARSEPKPLSFSVIGFVSFVFRVNFRGLYVSNLGSPRAQQGLCDNPAASELENPMNP